MKISANHFKYCAETRASLGPNSVLLRNPVNARTTIVERNIAAALCMCNTFASIEEHSLRLAAAHNVDGRTAAHWLQSAIESGIFISSPESQEIVFRCASSPIPRKIECVAIATRNRPEMLRRLLDELDENLAEFGRKPQITVLDDSDEESSQRVNAEVIGRFKSRSGAKLLYIDQTKRKRLVEQLTQSAGLLDRTAAFALHRHPSFPFSTGAAQNALLLASAGRCMLFLDDDIRCRTTPIPGCSNQIAVGDAHIESWFFESEREIEQCPFIQEDLLGLHERLLNFESADWASNLATTPGANTNELFRRLKSGEASVVISQMGILGDTGVDSPLPSYISGPETWARLVRSVNLYNSAIKNRLILRGAKCFFVTHAVHSQTHCLAVDNQKVVPPFLPIMRGQDGLFGLLVSKCIPNSLFGVVPRAILHSPQRAREFAPKAAIASSSRVQLSEAIMALVSTYSFIPGVTASQRMGSLGRMLRELRDARDEELYERINSAIEPLFIRVLHVVQSRLDRADDRAFWKNDLLDIRDAALRRLDSRDDLIPVDLEAIQGTVRDGIGLREIVSAFAELLECWQALVEASMKLDVE